MDKDKRKLTEKELKRKNDFEKLSSEMQQKGYKMKNVVIDTQKAKYLALLVMFPFMALTFWLYNNVNGFNLDGLSWGFVVVLPLLILSVVLGVLFSVVVVRGISSGIWFFTYRFVMWPMLVIDPFLFFLTITIPALLYRQLAKVSIIERLRQN